MKEAIDEFWQCFLELHEDLEQIDSADDPCCVELLEALHRIDSRLFFEFCSTPEGNEFIITADGNTAIFQLVEQVVAQAPEIEGWILFALKPQLGFPETTVWEDTEVVIDEVLVVPVFREPDELGLRLYVPDLDEASEEEVHNALLRALDSGLGEKRFAESIQATWVFPLSEAPDTAFPLPRLDEYLNSRGDPEA